MSIVLNELEWAERALDQLDLGDRPTETLFRIAKYYAHHKYSKTETRALLEDFLIRCNNQIKLQDWSDSLDKCVKYAYKYPANVIDSIPIYKSEWETISTLHGVQLQRLAFTLLCIAKYYDAANQKNDHWTHGDEREIWKMANVKVPSRRQGLLMHTLGDLDLVRFSKRIDNLNVRVNFVAEDDEIVMDVTDFRNLGYQYMMMCGDGYYECQCCGIVERIPSGKELPKVGLGNKMIRTGPKFKYCPSCAAKIAVRQRVESVMRGRRIKPAV